MGAAEIQDVWMKQKGASQETYKELAGSRHGLNIIFLEAVNFLQTSGIRLLTQNPF